jgi:hypothetical protein
MGMGDLDKDGLIDYAFSLSTEKQIALLNGANDQLVILSLPSQINGALKGTAVGDLDLDGDQDLVVTSEQSNLGIGWMNYTNSPFSSGWLWNPIYEINRGKFDQSILYDVDQDGDLDVLTTEEVQGLGVIWFENPTID